ncbi:hypothetical protein HOLleu_41924 [Holothuria leucospilota]|uniref:Uncharacterized protein n=1 Tax=Holothuria leucospilota TaxID=206669 RepID=A0A9Q0YC40_HOLLE|nr:hypothetical protein HOLleu_41924 [Holothuria leucospilota]
MFCRDVRENLITKLSHNSMTGLINATLNCVSPQTNIVIELNAIGESWKAILRSGYNCSSSSWVPRREENIKCTACWPGTHGKDHRNGGCVPCPPGILSVHIVACCKRLSTRPEVAGNSYEYPSESASCWKTVLAIAAFVTYPESCRIAFQMFFCDTFFMDQSKTKSINLLHADYSIVCDSEAHKSYKIFSLILLFYVLSFPIALLIFLKRKSNLDPNVAPRNQMWIHFVLENYKAECWYWEALEQVRKLSLVVISLRFNSQGFAKILGLSTSVLFLAIHIHKKPLKRDKENILQEKAPRKLLVAFAVFEEGIHFHIQQKSLKVNRRKKMRLKDFYIVFICTSKLNPNRKEE